MATDLLEVVILMHHTQILQGEIAYLIMILQVLLHITDTETAWRCSC